jgi:hypothetical protein
MRTTVTLDPDVSHLLQQAMQTSRQGFKTTLNAALRRGLVHQKPGRPAGRFVVRAKALGLRAGLDPARLHAVDDDLEVAAYLATTRRLARPRR